MLGSSGFKLDSKPLEHLGSPTGTSKLCFSQLQNRNRTSVLEQNPQESPEAQKLGCSDKDTLVLAALLIPALVAYPVRAGASMKR